MGIIYLLNDEQSFTKRAEENQNDSGTVNVVVLKTSTPTLKHSTAILKHQFTT